MDNFRKKFLEEATEHCNELECNLLNLENDRGNKPLIEKVFRSMHSLKGGGAMFGFLRVSELTHHLENVYDLVRSGQMEITPDLLTFTLKVVDHLRYLLDHDEQLDKPMEKEYTNLMSESVKLTGNAPSKLPGTAEPEGTFTDSGSDFETFFITFKPSPTVFDNGTNPIFLIDELSQLGPCLPFVHFNAVPPLESLNPHLCYTYWEIVLSTASGINAISDVFIFVEGNCQLDIHKISQDNLVANKTFVRKLTKYYNPAEDIGITRAIELANSLRPSVASKVKRLVEDKTTLTTKENKISSIRVSSDKIDSLMNLVSELVTTQARLALYTEQSNLPELAAITENVQKLTRQLRDLTFSVVLIPIENIITRFQRLVRDLSSELKKEVVFEAFGTDTELDKTIIENLTDPLMHILRNSLDHGIEDPAVRVRKGKPAVGRITFNAYYSGSNVHIEIADDGAGINPAFIREKAIKKGIISAETPLTEREIIDLIFLPGFSTAANITDVSGRGVGMDVVRKKIADIRGEVEVDTQIDQGTKLIIKLPLTLSIIDGLLVEVDQTNFVIPLSIIDKIFAIQHSELKASFNNVIVLDKEQVAYFNLRDEFGAPDSGQETDQAIVVRFEDKRVALIVDTIVGEYQAVLKPLGKYFRNQESVSGATILGDGTIALVMDTNKAIKSFIRKYKLMEDTV